MDFSVDPLRLNSTSRIRIVEFWEESAKNWLKRTASVALRLSQTKAGPGSPGSSREDRARRRNQHEWKNGPADDGLLSRGGRLAIGNTANGLPDAFFFGGIAQTKFTEALHKLIVRRIEFKGMQQGFAPL